MTKLRNLQSFSEIYFDDSQYIKIVKARVPQELTEKCLDIAKQNLKEPHVTDVDPAEYSNKYITDHTNLQNMSGRTPWDFHNNNEIQEHVLPNLTSIVTNGINILNSNEFEKFNYFWGDFFVNFYSENGRVTRHCHGKTFDAFSFVWYLDTAMPTTLDFVSKSNNGIRVECNIGDMFIFNSFLQHEYYDNCHRRVSAAGNLKIKDSRW